MNLTKLSGSATLFLVAVFGLGFLCDGLAIGNLRLLKRNGNLLVVLHAPFQRAQVELALAVDDGLAQFLALLHHPCWVFLAHLQQCRHHLLRVGGIHGLDGTAVFGVWIFYEVEVLLRALAIERVACLHILQLHGAADVAGVELVYGNSVGSRASVDLGDALLGATVGIGKVVARLHRARHHLEVAHLADVWLHGGLEEIERLGTIAVGSDFLAARIVHLGHVADKGNHVAKEFHQAAHAHVLASADTEHGEDAAGDQPLADAHAHLVLGQCLLLEELLHQLLVVLGGSLHKRFVEFHGLVHLLGGDVFDGGDSALGLPAEFLHEQYIDERMEIRACLKRVLDLYALVAVDVLHVVDDVVEVALFAVELVNEEDDGLAQLLRVAEVVLGAHFRPILSVDEDDRLVGDVERGDGSAYEVVGTRAVDDIEFLVVPFHMEYCWEDRVTIFQLNRKIVAHGVLCLHASAALDDSGFVKHTLGKCGLAATRTAKQCYVLDFIRLIYFHINRF